MAVSPKECHHTILAAYTSTDFWGCVHIVPDTCTKMQNVLSHAEKNISLEEKKKKLRNEIP